MKFIKAKEENDHYILNISKYFTFGLTGLLVLVVLLSSPLKSNFIERLQSSPNSNLMQISEWMSEQFLTDMILAFVFSAGAFWMLFLYSKNRINREFMLIALILLSVSDLFRVSSRGAKYVPNQDIQTIFNTPDYVNAIRNEKNTQPFRILNLNQKQIGSVNNNSNYHMYFLLEDFAGYSGIKPRAYQDYMDVVTPGNPTLWRMANIKYIVVEKPINYPGFRQVMASDKNVLYENINALPRAYFVDSVEVKKPIDILYSVRDNIFDPLNKSYVEKAVKVDPTDSTAKATFIKYEHDFMELDVTASANNFLFIGDTYYPEGWKATIDGKDSEILRANHNFRGIVVPKGNHKVILSFEPQSYFTGKTLSLLINILLTGGLILGIFLNYKEKNKIADKENNITT